VTIGAPLSSLSRLIVRHWALCHMRWPPRMDRVSTRRSFGSGGEIFLQFLIAREAADVRLVAVSCEGMGPMTESSSTPTPDPAVPPVPPPSQVDYQTPGGLEPAEANADVRMWGMFCHLASLAGLVVPVGNIIGPLVIWLIKKDQMPFVDDQGKESLNFQITMTIAMVVAGALMCVFVGFILLPAVAIVDIVFTIIATIKANGGIRYRYPMTLRLIK
jgi:uncharacterized protein